MGSYIQSLFAPLKEFNAWLNTNGRGEWYEQLATFLAKLPVRAARNIVHLLYNIVKNILYTAVHPLKSLNHLAKMLVHLAHELTKPEIWPVIGAGMIGASAGQALASGNPVSVIGMVIGSAALLAGLSYGTIQTAIHAEEGEKLQTVKQHLFRKVKELPEPMLTGFVMGLILGGIQRAIYEHQLKTYKVTNINEAKQFADQFVKEHHLGQYTKVTLDPSGKIHLYWYGEEAQNLAHHHPTLVNFYPEPGEIKFLRGVRVTLDSKLSDVTTRYYYYDGFEGAHHNIRLSLAHVGIDGRTYPVPPPNTTFTQIGPVISTSALFNSTIHKAN